ncbi:MAG: hemerythrin family protein [Bacteroidales bacterium]|nr:hemerythrin family protein [Bacteroidales bacterium]
MGVEVIDKQHKKLFDLINILYHSFMNKTSDEKLNDVLKELLEYTKYHFEAEEKMLMEHGYPQLKEHISTHEAFVGKVIEFRHSHRKGGSITMTVMNFLRKWLSDHILEADRDYIKYIVKN